MRHVDITNLVVVLSIGFGWLGAQGNAQAPGGRTEDEAIRAVIDTITDAYNKHDALAWTRVATTDAQLVTVRGESMNGATEIEKGLTALFQGRNRNASVKMLDARIRLITADVAIAHVTSELSGREPGGPATASPAGTQPARLRETPGRLAYYRLSQHNAPTMSENPKCLWANRCLQPSAAGAIMIRRG
jgi:uncharacterized protein (TIGR02246 family)